MLPRWHIILGVVFTGIIWYFAPGIKPIYLALIFLSSVLIDIDHYINAVRKTGKFSLNRAFEYHEQLKKKEVAELRKGIKNKESFHIFHTIEFHALIALIGVFFTPFFYIFLGMAFHSLLDIYYMLRKSRLYKREFFFFNWLRNKF